MKDLRSSNKMTQEELAKIMLVTKQAISSWERNVANPDHKQLCFLADLFKVSVDYMLLRTIFRESLPMPNLDGSKTPSFRGESDEEFSYDLQRILLTPSTQLHLGDYSLSIKDRQMLAEIINKIFERFHELNPN
ncbi:helix-turn-helix transcriptional regulator [Paenibacillus sp. 22594]|uniref:helix-turn-helix transcriptional regulator n=1 Tax=Paenibacillus sp. 22594 TaxID=3453947 RepID=UPI003F8588DD